MISNLVDKFKVGHFFLCLHSAGPVLNCATRSSQQMPDNSELEKVADRIRRRVKPGQTPDQESNQIERLVDAWSVGFSQDLQGQATKQLVEDFLDCFAEETRIEIEQAVETLHSLEDFDRFRRKMIATFAAVYANGVLNGREGTDFDFEKLRDAAGRKVHEQHKDVLKPIP